MLDVEQYGNEIAISYFGESTNQDGTKENKLMFKYIQLPPTSMYNWVQCEPDDPHRDKRFLNQEGKPVKKLPAKSLNKYRIMEIIHSLSDNDKKAIFAQLEPRKFFCDIETTVGQGFPDANIADQQVICITLFDQAKNIALLMTVDEFTPEQEQRMTEEITDYISEKLPGRTFKVKIRSYKTENLMLMEFFYKWAKNINFLSGWNFLKFDWLYLFNRAKRIGVDPLMCSVRKNRKWDKLSLSDKWDRKKKTLIDIPKHMAIVDYMMIYDKWDQSVKYKTNNSLDSVSNEVFGLKKLTYQGTLMDFYREDKYGFHKYNVIDTILVSLIDEKLGTFKTMLSLSSEGMVPLNDALFASIMVEMVSYGEFLKLGIVSTVDQKANNAAEKANTKEANFEVFDEEESYRGGWVYEPIPGLRKDVTIVDYESLFPSIMACFNTGIDVFIGKGILVDEYVDEFQEKVEIYSMDEYIDKLTGNKVPFDKEKHIMTSTGIVYSKESDSVMRRVVNKLLNNRLVFKHMSDEIENDILELKHMKEHI